MYYPIGWPSQIDLIGLGGQTVRKISCDRVKILFAVLTDKSLAIYYTHVRLITNFPPKQFYSTCMFLNDNDYFIYSIPMSNDVAVATVAVDTLHVN